MALQCSRLLAQQRLSGCIFGAIVGRQLNFAVIRTAGSAAQKANEDFDAKNARLGRPQSPHLTIYRPQLTSMLSITHRGTGMAMGSIVMTWGISSLFISGQFPHIVQYIQDLHLPSWFVFVAKLGLAFPLCYHYANGIRHLCWDMGKFLTIKEVYTTGWAILGIGAIGAFILASL